MNNSFDMKILIAPERGEVVVEYMSDAGVTARKNIALDDLASCINRSRVDIDVHTSGLLPPNCIGTTLSGTEQIYFLTAPLSRVDLSYEGTVYHDFPIPHMIFAFRYSAAEKKVFRTGVCVVPEGKLSTDTKLYHYPFSNVGDSGHICLGNNALPKYKRPEQLVSLPGYILSMPNNNDHYSALRNKMGLEYRDLLEHLKDKSPAYYYEHVLVENGHTLGQFLEWS